METIFDVLYLGTVLISAALLLSGAGDGSLRRQFGVMALILGIGDACHLIPRIYAVWDAKTSGHTALLGIGKLIVSITMTVFYLLLWNVGAAYYADIIPAFLTPVVFTLAALRIVLCLFPQNRWTSNSPPLTWAVWRNLPFFLMGLFVTVLFAIGSFTGDKTFSYLWVAVFMSFLFYAPVVLFSGRNSKVGMLMLPKSCAYAAIVLIGFSLSGI